MDSKMILNSIFNDIEKLRDLVKGSMQINISGEDKLRNIISGLQDEVNRRDKQIEAYEIKEVELRKEIDLLKGKNEFLFYNLSRIRKESEYHIKLIAEKNEEIEKLRSSQLISYDTHKSTEHHALSVLYPEYRRKLQKLQLELIN